MGLFDKPKVMKDYQISAHWPWFFLHQEGMSFNPIRWQGVVHWIVLAIIITLALGIFGLVVHAVGQAAQAAVEFIASQPGPTAILIVAAAGFIIGALYVIHITTID